MKRLLFAALGLFSLVGISNATVYPIQVTGVSLNRHVAIIEAILALPNEQYIKINKFTHIPDMYPERILHHLTEFGLIRKDFNPYFKYDTFSLAGFPFKQCIITYSLE